MDEGKGTPKAQSENLAASPVGRAISLIVGLLDADQNVGATLLLAGPHVAGRTRL